MKKKILIALTMCAMLISMAGCTVTKTTTVTDSSGNTVTKIEENSNGVKTTTTIYEDVVFSIANRTGVDIEKLYMKMADSSDWGNDLLVNDKEGFLDGDRINGLKTSFSLEQPKIDIKLIDFDGVEATFTGIDLSVTKGKEFAIALEYKETDKTFQAVIEQ